MNFCDLKNRVIDPGLCTHCGTCAALCDGIEMKETRRGPLPICEDLSTPIDDAIWQACPGRGIHYAGLNKKTFGKLPEQWLIGNVEKTFVGYSAKEEVRRIGASGGVITQILLYLLEKKRIQGAITLKQGSPEPWLARPIIATSAQEILDGAQSVYAPIPVNTILSKLEQFDGDVALVGLPDQIASIRKLQALGHPSVKKIKYLLGPYVGINMYSGAVMRFARSSGIKTKEEIEEVRYRDGEWPGYLRVTSKSGKTVKAEKFYYNYLLPFYITRSTLYSIDFANDFTDISVGDAWNPTYENVGMGFAVVVARNNKGLDLLQDMQKEGYLTLDEKPVTEVMNMHGHMFDFKKRGAFIRMGFRRMVGRKVPDYGIKPRNLGAARYLVEFVISGVILVCSNRLAQSVLGFIPIGPMGRFFNFSRKTWKNLSKPAKRKGLLHQEYTIVDAD